MTLHHEPWMSDPREVVEPATAAPRRADRAGLRMQPSSAGPTGAFVVVEVTILVVVSALAMASIIVSGGESDLRHGRGAAQAGAPAARNATSPVVDALSFRSSPNDEQRDRADVAAR